MVIEEAIALAPLSTMGVGGPARFFVRAQSVTDIQEALRFAEEKKIPVWILGGGSNTIFRDDGFPGLVIKIACTGITMRDEGEYVLLTASAGEEWDDVVREAVENNYSGIECLSGIPGLVGATPMQNVGAYGQEVAETILSVRVFDRRTLEETTLEGSECDFGYRTSRFKTRDAGRYIILEVTYSLKKKTHTAFVYPDLLRYAQVHKLNAQAVALADARTAVLAVRKKKSMVRDSNDPNARSCGSFFTNPIITKDIFTALQKRYPDMRSFPYGDAVKVSAAWLIEHAGFTKGYVSKGAGISERHALALINRGGGASDVVALAHHICDAVEKKFGIALAMEPVIAE